MATIEAECIEEHAMRRISGKADGLEPGASITSSDKHTQESNVEEISEPEAVQYPTGATFWLLMGNLLAVVGLGAIDMSIVATAVPSITDHFHTVADVGWYAVAFRLTKCAFQFLYARAYKLFPVKRIFLLANAFSFLGSVLCATAVSSRMLVFGRAVAGVGAAGTFLGADVMIIQSTPLHRRPMFQGLWAAVEGLATVAGPLVGGAITQTAGWRWCFWINLPIGGATLLLTLLCFSEAPRARNRMSLKEKLMQLDIGSNSILLSALICLFLALSWAGTKYPWDSGRVIGLIVTFGVLAGVFVYIQLRRGDAAALPLRIVKRRTVMAGLVYITLLNSAGNVLEYYLPIYYQAVRGYSPAKSGALLLPYLLLATLGAIGAGVGTGMCGYYVPFMLFGAVTMPIAAGLITTFHINTGLAKIIVYTGLSGLGYGVGATGPSIAVQTVLSDNDVILGMSVLSFGSDLGPAVFTAIAQVIFTNQLSKNLLGLSPGIDSTGLTQLVTQASQADAPEILLGIDRSITRTWYLVVGLACAMFLGVLPMEWLSVKKANPNHQESLEPASHE